MRGTPQSTQIIWLEKRVAELEQQVEQLHLAYRTLRGTLANVGQSAHEVEAACRRVLQLFPVDPSDMGEEES